MNDTIQHFAVKMRMQKNVKASRESCSPVWFNQKMYPATSK